MNRQDAPETLDGVGDEYDFEKDLQVAARSRMPVLISGSPRCAWVMAQAIAGRLSRSDRTIRIISCDAADSDDLDAAFASSGSEGAPWSPSSIVLLREVHALTHAGQSMLQRLMTTRPEAPRVVASSSVSLFERVKEGLFDPELFYHLNTIHIVTSEPQYD
jgi:transcriptional regulator of acetoin/glycerol metabolism